MAHFCSQVPETLPEEVLTKMSAPPKGDYPVIEASKMTEYDGFLFGLSGRFGTIPAQMKVCCKQNTHDAARKMSRLETRSLTPALLPVDRALWTRAAACG